MSAENSGGRVNYYLVKVDHPQREEQVPYQAECEDIMDALGLTPDEANIFKEIWRTANERTHGRGKEGNNPLRAAQKMVHYSGRILKKAERANPPKQSRAERVAQLKAEAAAHMQEDGDDWIEWNGHGEHPSYKTEVEIEVRSGNRTRGLANIFSWQHIHGSCDIVKYRVVS